ncbi:MAG: chromate transporter, partial [Amedibacillus dolichus]
MKTLFRLMFEFFKMGLFAVGGGLATLPFIYDMADKSGWFTHLDISNMIAISESTPGAMGINMSTYVGYLVDGISGAL